MRDVHAGKRIEVSIWIEYFWAVVFKWVNGVIGPPIMFENYESVKIDDGTFAAAPPHLN